MRTSLNSSACSYVVIDDKKVVFSTDDLLLAIGYRLGARRGAIYGQLLEEYPDTASPVLPRPSRNGKKSTKQGRK